MQQLTCKFNTAIAFKDVPFKDVKGKLYPIVGLKKKEDHIMANFGQRPFMFDIDGYMKVSLFLHHRCAINRSRWSVYSHHFPSMLGEYL